MLESKMYFVISFFAFLLNPSVKVAETTFRASFKNHRDTFAKFFAEIHASMEIAHHVIVAITLRFASKSEALNPLVTRRNRRNISSGKQSNTKEFSQSQHCARNQENNHHHEIHPYSRSISSRPFCCHVLLGSRL